MEFLIKNTSVTNYLFIIITINLIAGIYILSKKDLSVINNLIYICLIFSFPVIGLIISLWFLRKKQYAE
jgi:antibiotic biosynthesis monooxygenase (ABM) superfamily enzyme